MQVDTTPDQMEENASLLPVVDRYRTARVWSKRPDGYAFLLTHLPGPRLVRNTFHFCTDIPGRKLQRLFLKDWYVTPKRLPMFLSFRKEKASLVSYLSFEGDFTADALRVV